MPDDPPCNPRGRFTVLITGRRMLALTRRFRGRLTGPLNRLLIAQFKCLNSLVTAHAIHGAIYNAIHEIIHIAIQRAGESIGDSRGASKGRTEVVIDLLNWRELLKS